MTSRSSAVFRGVLATFTLFFIGASCAPLAETTAGARQETASGAPVLNLDYERFSLENGLTVIVHEDRKAPVVAVSIWYHVGSKNEPAGKTGFAHLFEHLMFNGSENYDGEWFEPLQRVGATNVNGTTFLDRTNYFQTVPTPALDLALWMESDRMGHLLGAVTQEKLDNQRGVVQNEKRQRDNQPYGRINYNLYEGLFPEGHPYHHSTIGSMDDLNAASLDDVHAWFQGYYGPNNAVLVLSGDIDQVTAEEKVRQYFGDIPAGPEVDQFEAWVPYKDFNSHEIQYDEVPAVLANRAWVLPPRNTQERALLDIAAAVLGQGRNSRFYRELIYDRQVASDVGIFVGPYEIASVFDLAITLNPGEDPSVATETMDRLIAEFIEDGPTDEEIGRVVTSINAATVRGMEEVNDKATILAEGELYHDDPVFVETYLEWVNGATPEAVREVAETYLTRGWHQVDVVPSGRYSALPDGVDRSAGLPAIPDDLPTLRFPDIEQTTLENGVDVVLARREAVPIVDLSIQFDAGYAADAGGKLGVASFAMGMLDMGTTSRTALEIAAEEERLGAEISAGSNLDASSVALSALRTQLEPSIDLWADLVLHPTFDQEEMDRLRVQWLSGIQQEKADPVALALRLLPPAMYGEGHAYAVPFTGSGTEESISSLVRDDLVAFRENWLRPDNATIFVVGDTTLDEIVPLLENALAGWEPPDTPAPVKNVAEVALQAAPRIILIDLPGSPQALILAGHLAPGLGTDRDLAIAAMNDVLGGDFTSRVNMNLREDKGWAYGAQTLFQNARGQRPFLVYAPVQSDRTGDSMVELVRELNAFRTTDPVTPDEMARTIAGSTRELPGQFETASAVLSSLVNSARYGRPLDYASTLTERYEALTLNDLRVAADDVIQPTALTWLVVGDLDDIRGQVEATGIAPVEVWTVDGERVD